MGFSCGFIGLPNVGKSTIFNALTSAKAQAANFPFCTIEPNTGMVPVPDPRIFKLAELANSAKIIPTQMQFIDIAGLIKGASQGEGLGNQFLSHIRQVDAVAHVVRCFNDPDVIHVHGSVDPLGDIETIETELMLADLDSISKFTLKIEKLARSGDKGAKLASTILTELSSHLGAGKPARNFVLDESPDIISELFSQLLSAKPVMFVANVDESMLADSDSLKGNPSFAKVEDYAQKSGARVVAICGKLEAEISELPAEDRGGYLAELGLTESGLQRVTLAGYNLLKLVTFFTVGPKEAHAWTIQSGTPAPQAAGKIHSDIERGFIRAEVISYEDYVAAGSEAKVKELGRLRVEGKDYLVQDGDICHFRFAV